MGGCCTRARAVLGSSPDFVSSGRRTPLEEVGCSVVVMAVPDRRDPACSGHRPIRPALLPPANLLVEIQAGCPNRLSYAFPVAVPSLNRPLWWPNLPLMGLMTRALERPLRNLPLSGRSCREGAMGSGGAAKASCARSRHIANFGFGHRDPSKAGLRVEGQPKWYEFSDWCTASRR